MRCVGVDKGLYALASRIVMPRRNITGWWWFLFVVLTIAYLGSVWITIISHEELGREASETIDVGSRDPNFTFNAADAVSFSKDVMEQGAIDIWCVAPPALLIVFLGVSAISFGRRN
jgi:hypothetical protein